MTTNNILFKSELLETAVALAKENGFQVYAFQKNTPISQVFITNESGVCTVSTDLSGMLNIGTCHKPCRNFGTGFRLNEDPIGEITVNYLNNAIKTVNPFWAKGSGSIVKYSNWEDYSNERTILTYFEI